MTYNGYVDFKLNFPCYFQGDSLDNFELELSDYIDNALNNNPISVDYGNASIVSVGVTTDVYNSEVAVKFSLDCDAYDDEDVFIGENSEIIQEFITELEATLDDLLATHDIFGYLPDGEYVIFDGDSLFVRLAYHQDSVRMDLAATTVSFEDEIDDVLSDTFYST